MSESDREFVERMESVASFTLEERNRLRALALRGAETQWRPIEEAERTSRNELLMWDGEKRFVGWWKSGAFWRERGEPFGATHFIPLTALGEPTPQPMEKGS